MELIKTRRREGGNIVRRLNVKYTSDTLQRKNRTVEQEMI